MHQRRLGLTAAMTMAAAALLLAGCGGSGGSDEQAEAGEGDAAAAGGKTGKLVLYCGRSRSLVEPLIERYRKRAEVDVQVKYGTDAQLLATLKEEGAKSPADLFWANTTGALGNAIEAGLLKKLPDSVLDRPEAYVPESGYWTPLTARFRVLAYNTDKVEAGALPDSVLKLPQLDQFKGRIGWTPTYSSFQDFVTALRLTKGEDAARKWLNGVQKLEPKAYSSNTPMIRALAAGEIDLALTNHYYVLRHKHGGAEGEYEGHEEGEEHEEHEEEEAGGHPDAPIAMHRFADGDVGNLALVTGAGVLKTSERSGAADFLTFLLSPEAQRFAAQTVHEYPVIEGVDLPGYMAPAEEAMKLSPDFAFERLRELEKTLKLMREAGLM